MSLLIRLKFSLVLKQLKLSILITSLHFTYPLVWLTVGAPRIIRQPLFSILLYFHPFEWLHPTLNLSILLWCLSISFSVCLSFSLLVQCPVGSSLQVLLILLCAHIISVCGFFFHRGEKIFIGWASWYYLTNKQAIKNGIKTRSVCLRCELCDTLILWARGEWRIKQFVIGRSPGSHAWDTGEETGGKAHHPWHLPSSRPAPHCPCYLAGMVS